MQVDILSWRQMATHVCRHAGMEADGYTCMQTCRHGGRWLVTCAGRHSGMEADGYTCMQTCTHGGRWLVTRTGRHSIMETDALYKRTLSLYNIVPTDLE